MDEGTYVQPSVQHLAEPVQLAQVQRAEVSKEGLVHQVLIDAEEHRRGTGARLYPQRHIVEFVCKHPHTHAHHAIRQRTGCSSLLPRRGPDGDGCTRTLDELNGVVQLTLRGQIRHCRSRWWRWLRSVWGVAHGAAGRNSEAAHTHTGGKHTGTPRHCHSTHSRPTLEVHGGRWQAHTDTHEQRCGLRGTTTPNISPPPQPPSSFWRHSIGRPGITKFGTRL